MPSINDLACSKAEFKSLCLKMQTCGESLKCDKIKTVCFIGVRCTIFLNFSFLT